MEKTLSDIPSESHNSANAGVINSLQAIYRKKVFFKALNSLFLTAGSIIASTIICSLLEAIFDFDTTGRAILFFTMLLAASAPVIKYVLPNLTRYFRTPNIDDVKEISLEVGNVFPELKDRLRNAVELLSDESNPDANKYHSHDLARAYIEQIFAKASHHDIASALKYRTDKRAKFSVLTSLFIGLVLFSSLPSRMPSALAAIFNFTKKTPNAYSIEVTPGDVRLPRGDTLKVQARLELLAASKLPSHITISEKYDNEREFEQHKVDANADGEYYFRMPDVRSSLEYFVSAGDQDSRKYHVDIENLPIVQTFHVTLAYPSYTKKGTETLHDNIGDFSALVGTRAEFTLQANKELRSARLVVDDSAMKPLEVSGKDADAGFIIKRTMKYTIRLLDKDSLQNRDPIVYTIQAVADEYPTCEITYPGKDVDLSRDLQLPLQINIGDDYGFTKLLVEYKLVSSKYVEPEKNYHSIEIPLEIPQAAQSPDAGSQEIKYTWDLNSLNLVPEDVISYHAKVFDNDLVNGPKAASSAEYQIRLPSLDEVFASEDSEHGDLISKTENALGNSNELQRQVDKLSNEMKTITQQMSWEQQKKIQSTLQRYEELQKKVDSLKSQIESMTQNMLENKVLSPQTLAKYMELQKALQEVNSPEFKDAMEKLQQAIQSMNPEQVRQAMQNFQINEEQFRQSIERTLSLIKRVEIEQKFDEMQKRVEQMMEQQESLQKSTAESDSTRPSNRKQLSENQKEIQKELSATKDAMSDLKNRMSEFADEMPMKQIDRAKEQLEQSKVEQQMQNSSQQLSGGEFSQAQGSQQQISSMLKDFQKTLSDAQKEMLRNQQKETLNTMRKAQQNLLEISKKQEELRNQSEQLMENSAESRQLAARQNELMQELNYTAQQMMQLSNKSFAVTPQMGRQIGEAYAQMQQALNNLQERTNQSSAAGPQTNAMGSMNQAAMSIQSTLQAMMNGQGSGGSMSLMQQVQELAGQQEGLNALTKRLGGGGELSMEQQAELSRLAAQQEVIQKSLEQLAQEAQQSAAMGAQDKVLGNLDEIANDMKDVVKDLQNNEIKPETIQRQQKILSRMLDASRSINKQDYDNRRQSAPGQNVAGQSPAELNLTNSNSEEDQELLKLIRRNFPPEYQKVILRYYQLLKRTPE
ncbi:MAG: DUF4175 family protein [Candidatus Kryptoniota bacterium]